MRELIFGTAAIGILLSFFVQLESIANDSSNQVIAFADDMDSGLSCVLDGKLLVDCQPKLFTDYGFDENLNETRAVVTDINTKLKSLNENN